MSDGGRSVTAKVVDKALAKTVIAKTATKFNKDTARSVGSKLVKSLPKQGVKSPIARSRTLLSAVHRTGITEKCSVFEPICIRPGGRDTVYCSDTTLATIAWATCTMDFRPETMMAKGLDLLVGVGFPAGTLVSRAILRALEARAAAAAAARVEVTFGHGARHLEGTGLAVAEVESAILNQVRASIGASSATSGSFWGRVTINGTVIEYRAHTLPSGVINVGTYYVPK